MKTLLIAMVCAVSIAAGCSNAPPRVKAPGWNPKKLADQLFQQADGNQDGLLTEEELTSVASVRSSLPRIDQDGDGQLSREEVEARFQLYRDLRVGITEKTIQIVYQRRPVVDAQVRLVPEEFLGDVIQPAEGTTDFDGVVRPRAQGFDMAGVQLGFYRLEVTCEAMNLPERFQNNSQVGIEISPISEGVDGYGPITVELQ